MRYIIRNLLLFDSQHNRINNHLFKDPSKRHYIMQFKLFTQISLVLAVFAVPAISAATGTASEPTCPGGLNSAAEFDEALKGVACP